MHLALRTSETGFSPLKRRSTDVVLRRLNAIAPLNPAETRAVEQLGRLTEYRAGRELVRQGERAPACFIVKGWACRQRLLADGRRQIFEFLVAGDPVAFGAGAPVLDASVVALTAVETLEASAVLAAGEDAEAHPALARALTVLPLVTQARMLDHVLRLGQLSAYERLIHLLLELGERVSPPGEDGPARFPMPLTQQALADALGLSIVHVNRVLQQLRRDGLIQLQTGRAELIDIPRLIAISGYVSVAERAEASPERSQAHR
jgi:CRP-like cAMP-binding protein